MDNLIVYKDVKEYIEELTLETDEKFSEMEAYVKEHYVPVITKDTRRFLEVLLSIVNPKKILEIGCAIGYSASIFANASNAHITTIELEEEMVKLAKENIKKIGFEDRITILHGDAVDVLPTLTEKYDLIFMDAAKGQYTEFFRLCEPLLSDNGIIISDNILFKGLVGEKNISKIDRSRRAIVRGLWKYLSDIMNSDKYKTSVLSIGDGVAITKKTGGN
ncbi:MAG: O-methyltransferase [Clostridia bacterium]|nr:O-methyltransferase [Clostridia bacterium]